MKEDTVGIEDLSHDDLLEQYSGMVRWWHYDPICRPQPSAFSVEELEAEVRRRMGTCPTSEPAESVED